MLQTVPEPHTPSHPAPATDDVTRHANSVSVASAQPPHIGSPPPSAIRSTRSRNRSARDMAGAALRGSLQRTTADDEEGGGVGGDADGCSGGSIHGPCPSSAAPLRWLRTLRALCFCRRCTGYPQATRSAPEGPGHQNICGGARKSALGAGEGVSLH